MILVRQWILLLVVSTTSFSYAMDNKNGNAMENQNGKNLEFFDIESAYPLGYQQQESLSIKIFVKEMIGNDCNRNDQSKKKNC